jgi:hypothetical protein
MAISKSVNASFSPLEEFVCGVDGEHAPYAGRMEKIFLFPSRKKKLHTYPIVLDDGAVLAQNQTLSR